MKYSSPKTNFKFQNKYQRSLNGVRYIDGVMLLVLRFENIEDCQIYAIICGCLLMAGLYSFTNLWISHYVRHSKA